MKRSLYFKTKDDVLDYYGALENIPSTDLVIVEDTGSMYAVSNNASIDGEMTPTGGDAAPDSPWIGTEDLASILNDPKSLELPLHIDGVSTCISSSFSTIKDNEEIITSVEYIYEVYTGNDVTVTVKVIVHDNENGDLSMAGDLEDNLNDYNDIYGNIYPILTDCTLSIYEEGGNNTRSMAPQYVLEGKIYAWNLYDITTPVQEITENGFYLNDSSAAGFNVDVPSPKDPFWSAGLDVDEAIDNDNFPIDGTGDVVYTTIDSQINANLNGSELIDVSWNWIYNRNDTDYTIKVVVTTDNDINGDSTGELSAWEDIYNAIDEYGDLLGNIYPAVTDYTMTKSSDPRTDGYDYLIEGNLWNWNASASAAPVRTITENGFYPYNNNAIGFDIDVPAEAVLEGVSFRENGTFTPSRDIDGWNEVTVNVPAPVLQSIYITTNGRYESGAMGVNGWYNIQVEVPTSSGSAYAITSAYIYDMMMQNVGNYTDAGTYMAYSFTLDSTTPNTWIGSAVNINNNYNCACNFGMELGDVQGNGSYTSSMNVVMQETVGGTGTFSLTNALVEQPNLSVDFLIKLYKNQGLYGFPVAIDYTISGFVPLVVSSMSYSFDGGMNYQSMSYDSTNNVYSATLNNVSVNTGGMLSPIVKVEYTTGAVKYLNGNVTLQDNSSPAVYPGYWNADPMQQMFYIDNMMGTTAKDITSLTVAADGNITVNFTDQAAPAVTLTRVYSEGTSSNTDLVDQGNNTWMLENVRDALVPGRVMHEVYSDTTSQSYQVDHWDSASETLYFTAGSQRDMNNYGEAGWNWLWDPQNKTLSHFISNA